MKLWQAIISGIIQGACEFLPISSSGHLVLLHHFLGIKEPQLLFDIFLHFGTLLAVVVYFRKDIYTIITKDRRFLLLILIGTMPTGIIGFLFESFFERAFANIKLVGFMLITTAILLFLGDFAARQREHHPHSKAALGFGKALIIGTAQGVAALPGLSRSGVTISTALICQVRKIEAIKYSFLMSVPAVVGALVFKLRNINIAGSILIPQFVAGATTAFLIGLASIYYLIQAIIKDRLSLFGIYCLLVGVAVLIRVCV